MTFVQDKWIQEFGMQDPRYGNSYNELTATFCVRIFKNIMPLVMEVLEKMKKDYYVEKDVCLSHGPLDLFKFISQVTEMYKYCPHTEVMHAMLSLVYKLMVNFQTDYKQLVTESDDLEIENFSALTNSNIKFMSTMRTYLDGVHEVSGIPLEEVQKSVQSNFLLKNFAEASNSSYLRIQELVKSQIAEKFLGIKDYKAIVIVD